MYAHTGSVKWIRGKEISASSSTMQLEGIANVDEAYKANTYGSDDEWAVDMGEDVEDVPEEEEEDEPSEPAVARLKNGKQAMDKTKERITKVAADCQKVKLQIKAALSKQNQFTTRL